MHHSRVQQVLRDARAMVGTVRPQTPTVPPARLNALNNTSAMGGSASSFPNSTLTLPGRPGLGDRLGSPSGTPPPEMDMLVTTDRDAKGLVNRNTAVGQQWAQALLSLDTRVRHRAAANIFRHCDDELFDTALTTVTRVATNINVQLLKAEGALAALLVAARHTHALSPTTNTTSSQSSSSKPYDRMSKFSMIVAAAAETDGMRSHLVTSGSIQTIGEVLPQLLALGGGASVRSTPTPENSATTVAAPPRSTAITSPEAIPFVAVLNLLTALRDFCEEYPHHILKVGLLDALVKGFGIVTSVLSSNAAKNTKLEAESSDAAAAASTSLAAMRPTSGAFASRFAFSGNSQSLSTRNSTTATTPTTTSSAVNRQLARQIAEVTIRILCQLSFDDDCLRDFRLRKDNLMEPLMLFLASVEPVNEPLLAARLMLLIARIIDSQEEACRDIVEYHWDTVMSKTFECLQKRKHMRKAVANYAAKAASAAAAAAANAAINSRPDSAEHSSTAAKAPSLTGSASSAAAAAAPMINGATTDATAAASSTTSFIDTVTSDAVIAALALLSNVTLVEEGGYTLAVSVPHMQCLMSLVNSCDDDDDDGEGASVKRSTHSASSSMKNRIKEARTTTVRYALIVLSNLSYYLPMMDPSDVEEEEGREEEDHTPKRQLLVEALAMSVCGLLFEGDAEAAVEATRILGNLSQTFEGKVWMEENGADEALVLFLGHEDHRLVYNCLGILLNLTADPDSDPAICRNGEAVALLLKHTQRLVASSSPWEIKEVVQMLLQNIQQHESRHEAEALQEIRMAAENNDTLCDDRGAATPDANASFGNTTGDVGRERTGFENVNDELEPLTTAE